MLDYVEASPVNGTRSEISKFASEMAIILGYKLGKKIKDIVTTLGGQIVYKDYDKLFEPQDGTILVNAPDSFEIHLPKFTSPLRDNFTIAHELGHYILHSNFGEERIKVNRFGSGAIENEANWFATGFLMPEKQFRQEYNRSQHPDTVALATVFNVSVNATKLRLEELGLSS